MSAPELARMVKARALPAGALTVEASEAERRALAKRFGVTAIHALEASVSFDEADGAVLAEGALRAAIEQPCAVTTENFTYEVEEPITLRFVPAGAARDYAPDEEIELTGDELDEIEFEGEAIDLGEALAQTLGLAIDPYREGPDADQARKEGLVSSEEASGAFAALAALRKK